MMSTDTEQFAALLDQELATARKIHGLMQQERCALAGNDLSALQQLQQDSSLTLQQLKDQAKARLQWLDCNNLPRSSECLKHPSLQKAATVCRHWQELESQYHDNQTLSQQLSDIVLTARQRTIQRLKILRGRNNDPHLYDGKGNASNLTHGQGYIQV